MGIRGLVKYLKSSSQSNGAAGPFEVDVEFPSTSTICVDATGFSFFIVEQFDAEFSVLGGSYTHYDHVCLTDASLAVCC